MLFHSAALQIYKQHTHFPSVNCFSIYSIYYQHIDINTDPLIRL